MLDKRSFSMPFKYWQDRDTLNFIKQGDQPWMIDPYDAHKALLYKASDGKTYLLNKKNKAYIQKQGPFRDPYYFLEDYMDRLAGHTAFVFAPGPSMDTVDLGLFKNKFTLTANSAGFKFKDSMFWIACESNWLLEMHDMKKIPPGRTWIMTSRCAVRMRGLGYGAKQFKKVYISRLEEEWIQPHRTPGVTIMSALFSAWFLGATKAYIIGLDLSRPKGQAYTSGVPYTEFGSQNPFDEQYRALAQFSIPEFTVYNGSPHSQSKLPFEKISYKEIEQIAKDSPDCVMVNP